LVLAFDKENYEPKKVREIEELEMHEMQEMVH